MFAAPRFGRILATLRDWSRLLWCAWTASPLLMAEIGIISVDDEDVFDPRDQNEILAALLDGHRSVPRPRISSSTTPRLVIEPLSPVITLDSRGKLPRDAASGKPS